MKYYFDGIIVVEGKGDVSYLSSFIDSVYVTTNGYEIPKEEVAFLNNKRNDKRIIVLTDSDEAGKEIRNKLSKVLNNKIDVEVDLLKCNKKGKHGVAECEKEEIINVLKEHFCKKQQGQQLNLSDLSSLELDKEKRECVARQLSLGKCNNKTFLKRLNYLNINKEQLRKYGNQ